MKNMSEELISLELPDTNSKILKKNSGRIYLAKYSGLAGLFNKKNSAQLEFAESVCDSVKQKFKNQGFFTTDELPAYGISSLEKQKIMQAANAKEKDLVAVFAYDYDSALKIKNYLDEILKSKNPAHFSK